MNSVFSTFTRCALLLAALFNAGCSQTQPDFPISHSTSQSVSHKSTIQDPAVADSVALQALNADYQNQVNSVQQLADKIGFLHITHDNLATFRANEAAKPYQPLAEPVANKKVIKGAAGQPDVTIYIINAQQGENKPALLYMHGGGYILGSAALSVVGMQKLAEQHDCTVVVVEYRLAPETAFPGSLEDNYAALSYMYRNAAELGIDKNKIVIMGSSAGGGHAAMLAIAARDRAEIPVKHQILIYPMLDDRTGSSRKVAEHIGQLLWTTTSNRFGWSALLGQPAGMPTVPYGSVPARVENLTNLAPADIIVGSIDLFVEEDIEYAKRLIQAGVPTGLHVLPGMFHASENVFKEADVSKQFKQIKDDIIHNALWD
ncbi:alpha/beta hydrolase [Catenovulum sp. 2E275]|uniref:alpha/beta hydrolase n=1 Tax=Catenovulum sp. 2E275 TaxID=2980497 RepID=UPI0021D1FDCC|nr:alpha/beta hydrolase [Catenovulum sp. 2E275]MCU4677291.1 alpha/beta hydrolase [Catenovulum sp. 2E275]